MKYEVTVVEDNELPEGFGWVVVRTPEAIRLLVKRSGFDNADLLCQTLTRAWRARAEVWGFTPPPLQLFS